MNVTIKIDMNLQHVHKHQTTHTALCWEKENHIQGDWKAQRNMEKRKTTIIPFHGLFISASAITSLPLWLCGTYLPLYHSLHFWWIQLVTHKHTYCVCSHALMHLTIKNTKHVLVKAVSQHFRMVHHRGLCPQSCCCQHGFVYHFLITVKPVFLLINKL